MILISTSTSLVMALGCGERCKIIGRVGCFFLNWCEHSTSCVSWSSPCTGCIFSNKGTCCAKCKRCLAVQSPQYWPASKSFICEKSQSEATPPGLSFVLKLRTFFYFNYDCSGVLYELQNSRAVLRLQQQPRPWASWGLEPTINSTQGSNSSFWHSSPPRGK